eukprot:scaffold20398_cov184-Amphora_coffeaeformis.AAC.3
MDKVNVEVVGFWNRTRRCIEVCIVFGETWWKYLRNWKRSLHMIRNDLNVWLRIENAGKRTTR